ncbi:hypothetical protein V2O64_00230 [Verrucomicrobiaceae bacterium 227]
MRRFLLTASLLVSSNLLASDLVTLKSGDVFTGEVLALSDGIITLNSPHSETPLKVRNEKLQRLKFGDTNTDELPKNSQVLNLRNGDTLPGQIVGLSETQVSFQTWFAGQLEIPRDQIESLFFGVTPQTTIYRGPTDIAEWEQGNDRLWEIDNGRLRSRSSGTIGRDFDLPDNFIFSTRFTWVNTPNLRIHLCSDSITNAGDAGTNSYLLNANSQGIQIKRVTPQENGRPQYKTLTSYEAPLRDMKDKAVDIEVRIDRSGRMLQLSINGEKLTPGFDPEMPPTGTHIVFESLSSGSRDIQIENIHLQEWDTKTQRFRAEPRTDEKSDTLTVDDGDRYSGTIVSFDPTSKDQIFVVKSPQSEQPISIPQANCSVMYFSKQEDQPESKGEYRLDLRSGGGLTLSGIKLGAQNLEATHPWLGNMTLDRRIMSSISKGQPQ